MSFTTTTPSGLRNKFRRLHEPNGRRPKPLKDGSEPEKVIQRRILDWLKATGLLHWRQNSGTVMLGYRAIKLGEEGLPDIIIIVPPTGRVLGLEVKSAKGTLRPKQKEFMVRIRAIGGHYEVVRSLDQARDAVAKAMGEELWRQWQASPSAKAPAGPKCGPN